GTLIRWVLFGASGGVVGTYNLSIIGDPEVIMGNSTATISLSLTNTTGSGNPSIGWVRFDVESTLYYVSLSNLPPAGWQVVEIKNAGVGQTYIIYEATSGVLSPGESETFNLVVTGTNDEPFPADVNNISDIFDAVEVKENGGNKAGTFTGNKPSWTRYGLATGITASPTSRGVDDNITLSVLVTNRTTVTQTGIQPGAIAVSGNGSVLYLSGPVPGSVTLDPQGQQVFVYTYQASSSGVVVFSGSASNGTAQVTSPAVVSNGVVIGDYTAQIQVSSSVVISGQQIQVILTLTNNGTDKLTGIVPNISTAGTASMSLDSGPIPAGFGVLQPGNSANFQWTFTITGNVGDTFRISGWGSSNTLTSNTATTPWGSISAYSAVVYPSNVTSGATDISLNFAVFNNGGLPVKKVRISTPSGWIYQTSSPPPGWSVGSAGNPPQISFTTSSDFIPIGGNEIFGLTFTSVPTVTSPTSYNFLIEIWDTGQSQLNKDPRGALETTVIVTPYQVILEAAPGAGISGTPIADGFQYYDITATVTGPAGPEQGVIVLFTTTVGSLGSGSALTDTLGQAFNTLTGPLSVNLVSATVTADYLGATDSIVLVFDPYPGLSLDYIAATLGPTTVSPGDTGIIFAVSVINTGNATVTLDGTSSFSFSDSSAGGTSVFTSLLGNSNPANIAPGSTAVLTFLAQDVDAGFLAGDFYPSMVLTDGFTPGARPVSDPVTVSGGSGPVIIIRWKESIE
ncbi:MAG: hypothetical protein ACC669_06540, partial [bacterium]